MSNAGSIRLWDKVMGRLKWLLPLFCLISVGMLTGSILSELNDSFWAYYTDDEGIRREGEGDDVRYTLREDPHVTMGLGMGSLEGFDPTLSPDGGTMILRLRTGSTNALHSDLYLARWNGREWSKPESLSALNTDANESGACWSPDGSFLYFSSDREGGFGQNDVYGVPYTDGHWGGVTNLGSTVNSAGDDLDPAMDPNARYITFASDRGASTGAGKRYDLYHAARLELVDEAAPVKSATEAETVGVAKAKKGKGKKRKGAVASAAPERVFPAVPTFDRAETVALVNTESDELDPVFTGDGRALYFASNRKGGEGGYDLYVARIVSGVLQSPENLGSLVNTGRDEFDPAVRWDGFDLVYSSSTDDESGRYMLLTATAREVVMRTDYSRWHSLMAWLGNIKWIVLVITLAVMALIYMLKHWHDVSSLFHKCLMGSAIVHVLLLILCLLWMVANQVNMPPGEENEMMVVDDNLSEEIAEIEMNDQVAEMADSAEAVPIEMVSEPLPLPEYTPNDAVPAEMVVSKTVDKSFVHKVTPSKAAEPVTAIVAVQTFEPLPEIEELVVEVVLQEPTPDQTEEIEVAEAFEPVVEQEIIDVIKEELKQVESPAVKAAATAAEVVDKTLTNMVDRADAPVTDTGGDVVVASAGAESASQLPALEGVGDVLSLTVEEPGLGEHETIGAGEKLGEGGFGGVGMGIGPGGAGAGLGQKFLRDHGTEMGASEASQGAVDRALRWLARVQEDDGHWNGQKYQGEGGHDIASTSFSLLCFYGWGATHVDKGPYQSHVEKALAWLVKQQKEDGDLRGGARNGMYDHGIATIVLCEAYGLTKDEKLKAPAVKALKYLVAAQDKKRGGWRYGPNQGSDTSVVGWQVMALKSAEIAGLGTPDSEASFKHAMTYLDSVAGGKHKGFYGYTGPANSGGALTAVGMFSRQLSKVPPTDPAQIESATYLKMNPLKAGKKMTPYYLYYGTLALYQHQGPAWTEWNANMKEVLVDVQEKVGPYEGSWDSAKFGGHARQMGRVISTAIATLSLEVYYRILPFYGFNETDTWE